MISQKELKHIRSICEKLHYQATIDVEPEKLKYIIKHLTKDEQYVFNKYQFDLRTGKLQNNLIQADKSVKLLGRSLKYLAIGILLIILFSLMGCSSTTKTEYVELPPKIKTEYVYIKCKVPKALLTVNNIDIKKEEAIKVLKKIAEETNDRKRKLEAIKKIECIEEF